MPKRVDLPGVPNAPKIEQGPSISAAMAPALGLAALGADVAQTATGIHRDEMRAQDYRDRGHLADVRHAMSLAQREHESFRIESPDPDTWAPDWTTRVGNVKSLALGDAEDPIRLLPQNRERLDRLVEHWEERADADLDGSIRARGIRNSSEKMNRTIDYAIDNGEWEVARDQVVDLPTKHARDMAGMEIDQAEKRADRANAKINYIEGATGPEYYEKLKELEKDNRFPGAAEKGPIRRAMEMEKRREDATLLAELTDQIERGEIPDKELDDAVPAHILPGTRKAFVAGMLRREKGLKPEKVASIRAGIAGISRLWFQLRKEYAGEELDAKFLEARDKFEDEHIKPNLLNKDFEEKLKGVWGNTTPEKMKQIAAALDASKDDPAIPYWLDKAVGDMKAGLDDHFDERGAIGRLLKAEGAPSPKQTQHEFEEALPGLIMENEKLAIRPDAAVQLYKVWRLQKKRDLGKIDTLRRMYFPEGGTAFAEMLKKAKLTQDEVDEWKKFPSRRPHILIALRRRAGEIEAGKPAAKGATLSGAGIAEASKLNVMRRVLSGGTWPEERTESELAREILEMRHARPMVLPPKD